MAGKLLHRPVVFAKVLVDLIFVLLRLNKSVYLRAFPIEVKALDNVLLGVVTILSEDRFLKSPW